jgi:hypothetical protein
MLQEDLKHIELLIQDNIKQYREQMRIDSHMLSTSLKIEIETIRGTIQKVLDDALNKLDKQLSMREQTVFSNVKQDIDDLKKALIKDKFDLLALQNVQFEKIESLEERVLKNEECVQQINKDMLLVTNKLEIFTDYIKTYISEQIERHMLSFKHKKG